MQDILVHTTDFSTWSAAMIRAARIAATFDGSLTAAYVCPSPPIGAMAPYGGLDVAALVADRIHEHESQACAMRAAFEAQAAVYGVSRAAWQVAQGHVPHVLQHLGNWHDLLVLERSSDGPWHAPAGLGHIILTSGMPCLILPGDSADTLAFDCIALAWNGTAEGLRAIHASRPWLARARRIVALQGRRQAPHSDIGWLPEFALDAYFARHGLQIESHRLDTDDESAGAALLDASRTAGADLLVMGAYGRPRFSEWLFGGATRHVLQHTTMPVLLRH